MSYRIIHSIDDFSTVLEQSKSEVVVVFKHSSTCDLSAAAKTEIAKVHLPVFELVVQTSRPLSNHIEEHFKIQHESPQAILIYQEESIYNSSHRDVTADNIHAAAKAG